MINWLNNNQGFVMSLLTLVYVGATIIIVNYSKKSIEEMKNAREAESRPYIFAYLHKDPRDLCFYFRIKNYGKTGGLIKNINVVPILEFVNHKKTDEFLNNVVLAPNQMLYFIIPEESKTTSENNYTISIEYLTIDQKSKFTEEYTLVTQYDAQMGHTETSSSKLNDEANALKNIAAHLDSIRNKF